MKAKQLEALQSWLKQENTDVGLILNPENIGYLTGYQSDPHERVLAVVFFPEDEPFFFTPGLEADEVKNNAWPYPVYSYLDTENPWELIKKHINEHTEHTTTWAVEKDYVSLARYEALKDYFPSSQFTADLTKEFQLMKLVKTPDEIEIMKEAGELADFAFEVGFKAIQAGKMEQEIVAEIEYELKKKGVTKMSFSTIVLTGDNASSPHGTPGERKVQKGDLVLFDLGVVHKGYTSDATRTVAYGEPSEKAREIYQIVLEAQLAATKAVKPGVKASDLDKIARGIITDAGYGPYFMHRLGHGIGSSVHEFPSIMETNDMILEEGMCFSIEPGIYVNGVAGVRIEDCVYVTKDGCESFTHTPKELTII